MNCPECQKAVEETDATAESLTHAAKEHLRACQPCQVFWAERIKLQQLINDLGCVPAPLGFEHRLNARLTRTKRMGSFAPLRLMFTPSSLALAAAACFALTLAVALLMQQKSIRNTNSLNAASQLAASETVAVKERPSSESSVNRKVDALTTGMVAKVNPQLYAKAERVNRSQTGMAHLVSAASNVNPEPEVKAQDSMLRSGSETKVINSSDAGSLVASVTPSVEENNQLGPIVTIPVRSSGQALKVAVPDKRGVMQVIQIEPVAFGANQPIKHLSADRTARASLEGNEVVW